MKKTIALIISALMLVSLAACGGKDNSSQIDASDSSSEISKEASENSEAVGHTSADYKNSDISEWKYAPITTDDVLNKLITIDSTEYGSAGSSMKGAISAACLLQVVGNDSFSDKANGYLDEMNDTQRDYFSFQWQMAYKTAENIVKDFDSYKELLSDAGYPDFSVEGITAEALKKTDTDMKKIFEKYLIRDEWKNNLETEPFNYIDPFTGSKNTKA